MIAPLLALTSYYNPFHGERRRHNYHVLRKNLGVPLVTVEWSPDGRFDLSPADADVMIRVEGGDIMWQKERLLNIGLARIRAEALARDVAMVDADVVFARADWAGRVSAALDRHSLVQCHSRVDYLPPVPAEISTRAELTAVMPTHSVPSQGYALSQGEPLFKADAAVEQSMAMTLIPTSGNCGMSNAVRLADLPHFELYDGNIVGGGDLLLTAACIGVLHELFHHRNYSPGHQADIHAWAARCLSPLPRLGWTENPLLHLWHGTMENRQYGQRLSILAPRDYDPARDVDRSGEALRFSASAGELKTVIRAYLASRKDA